MDSPALKRSAMTAVGMPVPTRTGRPKAIRIFSRDEWKHQKMREKFAGQEFYTTTVSHLIGDIRDEGRLRRAMEGADIVFHAAAMKQVPACEYNPLEAINTNVLGSQNVLNAALDTKVQKVMFVSTDKAVNPRNIYGATKLCAEKIFIYGNSYAGPRSTRFSCCRYGNVFGSRGSVVQTFLELSMQGQAIPITDKAMTRFWIRAEDVAKFLIDRTLNMQGGEIFVPKMPSMKIVDLAESVLAVVRYAAIFGELPPTKPPAPVPGPGTLEVGVRPGEKLHETLVTAEETEYTEETDRYFIIRPGTAHIKAIRKPAYTSNTNDYWLSQKEAENMIADIMETMGIKIERELADVE